MAPTASGCASVPSNTPRRPLTADFNARVRGIFFVQISYLARRRQQLSCACVTGTFDKATVVVQHHYDNRSTIGWRGYVTAVGCIYLIHGEGKLIDPIQYFHRIGGTRRPGQDAAQCRCLAPNLEWPRHDAVSVRIIGTRVARYAVLHDYSQLQQTLTSIVVATVLPLVAQQPRYQHRRAQPQSQHRPTDSAPLLSNANADQPLRCPSSASRKK